MTIDYNPSSERLNRAILFAVQAGSIGVAALLRAVRDGRISLHISQPENAPRFKDWAKTTARQAAVALIGDDDGFERGAAAWGGYAYRIVRWSTHVMMHAAGAEPGHYEGAVRAAEEGGRVLVIETCVASAPSWLRVLAAIPRRHVPVIWPTDCIHPVPENRSRAH
jgi:hypothetical protein